MRRLLILAAAVVALAGCSTLDHGTVTDKTHEPDASFYMPVTQCFGSGASQVCVMTLQYYPIPECWHIWFVSGQDKGDRCVSEQQFGALQVGDQYNESGGS